MARLRNLIGCILNEFTYAQHSANTYTARLGKEYTENDLLRYFMIPNAFANGLTFNLKFAVKSTDEIESVKGIDYQKLYQFFSQLAVSVAETTITSALYTAEGSIVKGLRNYQKLKDKEAILRNEYHDYLSKLLRKAFIEKAINEIDSDGNPDHNKIAEIAMEVIDQKFFNHPELQLENIGIEYFNDIKNACSSFVNTLIEHSCKHINVLETRESEILDIIIDEKSLVDIPPENIQQISFNVNLRNYQISKTDSLEGSVNCIIPVDV